VAVEGVVRDSERRPAKRRAYWRSCRPSQGISIPKGD
jgi:hypothetical protein